MTRQIEQSGKDELYIISTMMKEAEKSNLLTEIIWSFGNNRSEGLNVDRACAGALNEWDI